MSFHKTAIEQMEKYKNNAYYLSVEVRAYSTEYGGKLRKHILPDPKWSFFDQRLS